MKSLKIVDRKLSEAYSGGQFATDNAYIEDDELFIIRKDLEILEIIRKKKVDIKLLISSPFTMSNEKILEIYNKNMRLKYLNGEKYQLTLEELLKLKQWLEENKNDR